MPGFTAFQRTAFQDTAFQIEAAVVVIPPQPTAPTGAGMGGKPLYRRMKLRRRRKRYLQEELAKELRKLPPAPAGEPIPQAPELPPLITSLLEALPPVQQPTPRRIALAVQRQREEGEDEDDIAALLLEIL